MASALGSNIRLTFPAWLPAILPWPRAPGGS
jgi:hypothetical protein